MAVEVKTGRSSATSGVTNCGTSGHATPAREEFTNAGSATSWFGDQLGDARWGPAAAAGAAAKQVALHILCDSIGRTAVEAAQQTNRRTARTTKNRSILGLRPLKWAKPPKASGLVGEAQKCFGFTGRSLQMLRF